jgi:hypothetical protein
MNRLLFDDWFSVARILSLGNIWDENITLVFDKNRFEGLLYKNDFGFSSLGYTDGMGYDVWVDDFLKANIFIDIFSSKKKIKDDYIEFKKDRSMIRLDIQNSKEVCLPVWEKGENFDISENTFNFGDWSNYYLIDGKLYASNNGMLALEELKDNCEIYMKLPVCFVATIINVKFPKFVVGEKTLFLSKDDLEVTIFYEKSTIEECDDDRIREEFGMGIKRKALRLGLEDTLLE